MSSTKKTFEANVFEASTFASGVWRGIGVDPVGGGQTAVIAYVPVKTRRIPNPESKSEVREAFQELDSDVLVIEDSMMSVDTIAAVGSLVVKDSDTTEKTYSAFSQGTDNQVLVSAGVGVDPVWTTDLDGLTLIVCDNITINGAAITSDTGAISFSDENLSTTGTLGVGTSSVYTYSKLDVEGPYTGGNYNSQLHLHTTNNAYGLFAGSHVLGFGSIACGSHLNSGGDFLARHTSASIINYSEASILIQCNSGLTAGVAYTPTTRLLINTSGISITGTLIVDGWTVNKPTVAAQLLQATGANASSWTTDITGLTSLGVDNITINGAVITSDTGAISFSNENLTTTGTLGAGATTVTSLTDGTATLTGGSLTLVKLGTLVANGFVKTSAGDGTLSVDPSIYLTAEADTLDTVADRGATTNQTLVAGGFTTTGVVTVGAAADMVISAGSITSVSGAISFGNENLVTTGTLGAGVTTVTSVAAGTLTLIGGSITDSTGAISFGNENLSTTGTVVGSNIPSPTIDDQILISTAAGIASWSTATNNQVLASGATGEVAWINKPFGYLIPANSAANEVYAGTGVGTAAWTTDLDGLTLLVVDNITINGAVITSDTGAISFGDENLTTTGNVSGAGLTASGTITDGTASLVGGSLTSVKLGTLITNGFVKTSTGNGTLSVDPSIYLTAEADTLDTVSDRGATTDQTLTAGGFITSTLTLAGGTITDSSGAISFGNENLSTTGKFSVGTASIYTYSELNVEGPYTSGNYNSQLHLHTTNNTYGLFAGSHVLGYGSVACGSHLNSGGDFLARHTAASIINFAEASISFQCDSGLTAGVAYTPATRLLVNTSGITVTGTVVGNNIPSPAGDSQVLVSSAAGVAAWNTSSMSDAIETAPAAGNEDKVLIADSSGDLQFQDPIWPRLLSSNETIFIRQASGNDSNDGESSGTALLTIQEGINRLYRRIANGYTITMDLGEGVYTLGAAISPAYPYGYNVEWQGSSESHTSCAISNVGAVTASGLSGLDYIDFDITLPVTYTAAVGDFISVTSAASGSNPHLTMGCHEVTVWTSGTRKATVRCYRRSGITGAPVPDSSVVVSITVVKTVLYFNTSNGLKLDGAFHSGWWGKTGYGICFKGAHDDNGIWALNGASIILGNDACTSGWGTNLYAQNGGLIFADYTVHSKSNADVIKCQNGATVNLRFGSVISGSRTRGVQVFLGGNIAFGSGHIYTCGASYGIHCYQGGAIDFDSGTMKDGNASAIGVQVATAGVVNLQSYTNTYDTRENIDGARTGTPVLVSSANRTGLITDNVVLFSTGASDRTYTLPPTSSGDDIDGMQIHIKKIDSGAGNVIVDGNASETVDDLTTVTLYSQYDSITVVSHAGEWYVIEKNVSIFGETYAFDAALTHVISGTGIGNKVQVTAFNANGELAGMTPDHTNDHITVLVAGKYMCTVSINLESVAGGAQTVGVAVYKNNGATLFSNLHMHRKLSGGGGDLGAVSLNGIIDLAASDTIEVWIWNSTTGNVIVDDVTLTLVRSGE